VRCASGAVWHEARINDKDKKRVPVTLRKSAPSVNEDSIT
jgi:hypothetical protein